MIEKEYQKDNNIKLKILRNKLHKIQTKKINAYKSLEENSQKIEIIQFSDNLLKIKKGKYYYLLDRYKYDLNSIMMLLDLSKINRLHDIYKNYPDGIEKINFVQKMKNEITYNANDPMDCTNLVYGLYKFFCEIDFNGDNLMQWEEFTQFIIDTVEGDSEAKVEEKEDDNLKKLFNEKKMFKYKKYYISKKMQDNVIHKKEVISAIFLPRIDLIIVNEYETKELKIYNPKNGKIEKIFDLEIFINPKNYSNLNENKYKKKSELNFLKKSKGNVKNSIYSVLSMAQYQSIVAICLSDKRIIFLNFASDDRIEFIHEMYLPVLEKRVWYLKEHNIWVSSGCQLELFPYYTLNELDIKFEYHNQKYECLFNNDHPYRKHYCKINPHKGEIMDCLEIIRPMTIITACMDGKIRLLNTTNNESMRIWNYHNLGVRALDYNPLIEGIGYILSVGFEYYINLYSADLTIDEVYRGKLEGHYSPVITCKFIAHSYMAVSIDEEGNVRIWDTRVKKCLQLISPPKKRFRIKNLLGLFKYNKFMVYGTKIIYYDAKYKEEDKIQRNEVKDENYPIKVEYNYYYQQFFVATFKDIRIYTKDGELYKIYRKLISNEHFDNNEVKIKTFIFENNYRKFYIGFSNGAIMQYNAGNGSLVKPINENEVEKEGIQTFEFSHSKDISSLYYYHNENDNNNIFLLSSSFDSSINIYNEKNPEETEQLRKLIGGHSINGKNIEILCMDFSMTLSLIATGGSDGFIVVWDFEMSKVENFFLSTLFSTYKVSITFLKFLEPYPLLAASYTDGTFYFWRIKHNNNENECIFRARNYDKSMGRIDVCNIKFMNIFNGKMQNIKYDVPLKKYFDENSPFMNNRNNNEKEIEKEENNNNLKQNEQIHEANLDIVPEIFKDEIIDKSIDRDLYDEKERANNTLNNNEVERPQYYLIIGDEHGNIKIIDLIGFFRKNKIEPSSKATIKSMFNLYKKDNINVSTIIHHNLSEKKEEIFPKFTNLYYKMLIKEFKAHFEEITCITIITEPLSFITCSKDEYVKIFNLKAECIGVINAIPKMSKFTSSEVKWNFKVNEKKILEKEISDVVNIFQKVGVEPIMIGSNLDKKMNEMKDNLKAKEESKNIKKDENLFKKRFKPFIKENDNKKRPNSSHGISGNINYEGYNVQKTQKKIENLFNREYPNYGINEITNQLIGTMVEADNKRKEKIKEKMKKIKKEKEKMLFFSYNSASNTPRNINIKKNPIKKSNSQNNIELIIDNKKPDSNINKKEYRNNNKQINFSLLSQYYKKAENNPLDNALRLSSFSKKNDLKNNPEFVNTNQLVNLNNKALSPTYFNIIDFPPRRTSNLSNHNISFYSINSNSESSINHKENQKEELNKKIEYKKINDKLINFHKKNNSTKKNNSFLKLRKIRKINPYFRDELFSERLHKNNYLGFNLKEEIIKENNNIFDRTQLKLNHKSPTLFDKIIFKRGETEKLLNYQFYSSSYRSCCETKKEDGITNLPIKTNYKNNWKMVRHFVELNKKGKINKKLKTQNIFNKLNNNKVEIYSKDKKIVNIPITNATNYKTSLNTEMHNFLSDNENSMNFFKETDN